MPREARRRGYSRAFAPHGDGKAYYLNRIPAGLWSDVRMKAKRDGVSVRALTLQLLTLWANGAITLPDDAPRSEGA